MWRSKGNFEGIHFFLPMCRFWDFTSGHQTWQQAPAPTEQSCYPCLLIFVAYVLVFRAVTTTATVVAEPHAKECFTCVSTNSSVLSGLHVNL